MLRSPFLPACALCAGAAVCGLLPSHGAAIAALLAAQHGQIEEQRRWA
jgi:hypothetical protein